MKTFSSSLSRILPVSLLFLSLWSCKKGAASESNGPSTSPTKNVIQGTVYDAQGKRFHIAGANVIVQIYGNGDIGKTDPLYNIQLDANSHYALTVPNNVYAVHARAYLMFNGKQVALDLKALDGKPDNINLPSAPGIVRDFALQLTGEIPGGDNTTIQGYYGAKIWLGDGAYNFTSTGYWDNLSAKYPGASIQITLTPNGPLIDGTPSQTLKLQASVDEVKGGKWFVSPPLAAYKVTAVLIAANGQQKNLRLTEIPNITTASTSVTLLFPPDPTDPFQRPGKEQIAVWE